VNYNYFAPIMGEKTNLYGLPLNMHPMAQLLNSLARYPQNVRSGWLMGVLNGKTGATRHLQAKLNLQEFFHAVC